MKIGYFGKLPGYGDFVQRNVSPALIKYWDTWVLQSFETSRTQLRESWQQRYFNSPIWRFVISKDIMSPTSFAGVMMPSVDKAGRCYPFIVFCEAEADINPFTMARIIDQYQGKSEEFIMSLLEKTAPNLDDVLAVLTGFYQDINDSDFTNVSLNNPVSYTELGSLIDPQNHDFSSCNETFLHSLLYMQKVKPSIWWTSGGVGLTPRKRYFSGMPPVDVFDSLLLGADT